MTGPALGYAFILAVCVIWVGGSFLVESLEGQGLSPLLLTFICNALFVVLLPVYFLNEWMLMGDKEWRGWGAEARGGWQRLTGSEGDELATATTTGDARVGGEGGDGGFGGEARDARGSGRRQRRTFSDEDIELDEAPTPASPPRPAAPRTATERDEHATVKETVWAAFIISPLWFAAQLCFNYSLLYTSVTSNSILSTSSSVFTSACPCTLSASGTTGSVCSRLLRTCSAGVGHAVGSQGGRRGFNPPRARISVTFSPSSPRRSTPGTPPRFDTCSPTIRGCPCCCSW